MKRRPACGFLAARRAPTLACGLVGSAISLVVGSCASRAALPPLLPTPGIVYSSTRDGNVDLYLLPPGGPEPLRLTDDPAPDQFPRCSADGRSVAFVRGEGAAAEIYRLDLADGTLRRLTSDATRDATPAWSADGARIYFTRRSGDRDRLAVIGRDGGEPRFLTDGAAHDVMPAVSPDGGRLVHHTYRYQGGTELQLLDLVEGTSRRLTDRPGNDYEATFAGDAHVVFSSNLDAAHYRLFVLSLADSEARLLADTGADAWGARYSPATGEVLFYTGARDAWRLMKVPLAGGAPVPVIADGHSNSGADWCAAAHAAP
jgi:TolB protein